ncbi:MAG: MmgE/PrpD family protein [Chloroflexi bacterium]|nr:MmgE/PrpD family protein [Chloroflexota bacterium]
MIQVAKELGITRALAQFASSLAYDDLPAEAVERTKYLCLDFAGVTLNGSTTPSAQAVQRAIERAGRPGPSVIAGTRQRALPEYAGLANGVAFHSIEMDDVNNEASLHPGVATFPAALAAADLAPVDGKAFITAVVAGYDVMVRLGRALKPAEHYGRGFHPTATCGTFGATTVAARLLGLPVQESVWALGIAGSQAAGSMEFLAQGTWTKRFHPGWAVHSGIWAALLAREGFTGPATIIEGKSGFLRAYSGNSDPELVLRDLGEVFHITRTSVKPHACCRYSQGPIDCLLDLVHRQGVKAEVVEHVRVGVLGAGWNIVAAPEEQRRSPKSVVETQFSMPFAAAVALLYGRASLAEHTLEVAQRPEVRDLMARVQCVRDPALDAPFPQRWPAWAEVRTRDGRTLRSAIEYPKGDPENALTWEEMKEKFLGLTAPVVSRRRQQEVIRTIEALDTLGDMRRLGELLASE